MKHLHLVVVSVTCCCHTHVFGSLSCWGTLEVKVLLPVVAELHHVPCHWQTVVRTYFVHILHYPPYSSCLSKVILNKLFICKFLGAFT